MEFENTRLPDSPRLRRVFAAIGAQPPGDTPVGRDFSPAPVIAAVERFCDVERERGGAPDPELAARALGVWLRDPDQVAELLGSRTAHYFKTFAKWTRSMVAAPESAARMMHYLDGLAGPGWDSDRMLILHSMARAEIAAGLAAPDARLVLHRKDLEGVAEALAPLRGDHPELMKALDGAIIRAQGTLASLASLASLAETRPPPFRARDWMRRLSARANDTHPRKMSAEKPVGGPEMSQGSTPKFEETALPDEPDIRDAFATLTRQEQQAREMGTLFSTAAVVAAVERLIDSERQAGREPDSDFVTAALVTCQLATDDQPPAPRYGDLTEALVRAAHRGPADAGDPLGDVQTGPGAARVTRQEAEKLYITHSLALAEMCDLLAQDDGKIHVRKQMLQGREKAIQPVRDRHPDLASALDGAMARAMGTMKSLEIGTDPRP